MTYQLKNIRILVVDSNPSIRHLLRSLLLDLGIGMVDMANDPDQAWQLFEQFKPDILFIDWPVNHDTMALDFVRRVRHTRRSPNPFVPILLMTGFSNEDRVYRARDAGITEFLTKPFTVQNLVRYITHIVENPRPFIYAPQFNGPDRRRRRESPHGGERRARPSSPDTQSSEAS